MEERLTCLEKSKDQVGTVAHVKRQKLLINMQDAAKTPRKSCSSAVSLPNIHVQKSKSKSTPSLSTDISQSSKSAEKLDDSGISLLDTDTSITGSKLRVHQRNDPANANISSKNDFAVGTPDDIKLLKPLALFGNSEERDLAAVIHRDIFTQSPNVRWSDVVGLDRPKQILKEAVVFPLKYPE
jgi:SpoVK/Ycf46/Vps4 family AAA+-type ATPase